jgi:hypothetical protein
MKGKLAAHGPLAPTSRLSGATADRGGAARNTMTPRSPPVAGCSLIIVVRGRLTLVAPRRLSKASLLFARSLVWKPGWGGGCAIKLSLGGKGTCLGNLARQRRRHACVGASWSSGNKKTEASRMERKKKKTGRVGMGVFRRCPGVFITRHSSGPTPVSPRIQRRWSLSVRAPCIQMKPVLRCLLLSRCRALPRTHHHIVCPSVPVDPRWAAEPRIIPPKATLARVNSCRKHVLHPSQRLVILVVTRTDTPLGEQTEAYLQSCSTRLSSGVGLYTAFTWHHTSRVNRHCRFMAHSFKKKKIKRELPPVLA